jgi:hypothetical protein
MVIKVSESDSIDELKKLIDDALNYSDTKGLLILTCAGNKFE